MNYQFRLNKFREALGSMYTVLRLAGKGPGLILRSQGLQGLLLSVQAEIRQE